MDNWNLYVGEVKYWNDSTLMHETVCLNMEYNCALELPAKIERVNPDGRSTQSSREFSVREIRSSYGNIEICEEIYDVTDEQLDLIKRAVPIWEADEDDLDDDEVFVSNGVIYLGLVFHYSANSHGFVLSDLEIDQENISLRIKEYNAETLMVTGYTVTTSVRWEASFVKYQDDRQMYEICGKTFLLNETQANYIDCVQMGD